MRVTGKHTGLRRRGPHSECSAIGKNLRADSPERPRGQVNCTESPDWLLAFSLEGLRIGTVEPLARTLNKAKALVQHRIVQRVPLTLQGESTKSRKLSLKKVPQSTEPVEESKSFTTEDPVLVEKLSLFSSDTESEDELVTAPGAVYLLSPVYIGRPPTVLFNYPPQCMLQCRAKTRGYLMPSEELNERPLSFKISKKVHTYNAIVNSLSYAGFTPTQSGEFNVCFSWIPRSEHLRRMRLQQKINHFPGVWQLGRKDYLWRSICAQRRKFGRVYDICPKSYVLPEDYHRVQIERGDNPNALWILKPVASSCGRGIKLLSSSTQLRKKPGYIVSQYIDNPHTINGLKYDLRVYVCVTNYDPLKVYVYKDGLARFATAKYTNNKKQLKKKYIHLTNFSVNKRSAHFVKNQDSSVDGEGSKWSLSALKQEFRQRNIDSKAVFTRIHDIVIKALIAVEPAVVNAMNQSNRAKSLCFEVYGFDILLDTVLRPWLLEVNVFPSLSSSSPLDKRIKTALMCDVLTLAGVLPFNKKNSEQEPQRFSSVERTKTGHRNMNLLQCCSKLENYELHDEDLQVLLDYEEEGYRTGQFKRIFPLKQDYASYVEFFQMNRYNNLLLWKHLASNSNVLERSFQKHPRPEKV